MLDLINVRKTFNPRTVNERVALDHINLHLNDGDFVTIIGGNGAGKSTILNAIAGVWPVDEGSIIIDGNDVTNLPEHRRAAFLGRVFQDPMTGTAASMQIEENLALARRRGERRTLRLGITRAEREEYRERLKTLGQALTLLMATLKKPKLLLLDEHTAALDPHTAAKVLQLSDQIVRENGLMTMMVTHNMRDAIAYGNRLIMMHAGNIILDISGEDKKKLTVPDLMEAFARASGGEFNSDRALLG